MKILLHVNYCEGAGKIDTLFKLAKINGYDGIELRSKYRFEDLSQEQYLNGVAEFKNKNPEMEIVFSSQISFARGAVTQVANEVEEFVNFMAWAKQNCGTRVINFFLDRLVAPDADNSSFHLNGSTVATEEDFDKSAAGLRTIGEEAAGNGMSLALETHNSYLHDLTAPCRKLMDLTAHNAVGINYDHGNIFINRNGGSIREVFDVLGDKIYYAHLKNLYKFGDVYMMTQLEHGHIDCTEIMDGLGQFLKSGMLATEYPCSGDGIIAAKRDMEYINFIRQWLSQNQGLLP